MFTENENIKNNKTGGFDVDSVLSLCKEYFLSNDSAAAIKLLLEALENNAGDDRLLFELGKMYFLKGNEDEAEKYLAESLKYNNFNLNSLDFMGKIYKKKKLPEKAAAYYLKILKADKYRFDAYKELINIYFFEICDYAKAAEYTEAVLKISKEDLFANIMNLKLSVSMNSCGDMQHKLDDILTLVKSKQFNEDIKEMLADLARFLSLKKKYIPVADIIGYMKDYCSVPFVESFFSDNQYDFAVFLKNISTLKSGGDILVSLLDKIPAGILKIRNMILNELEMFEKKIVLKSKPRAVTVVLTNRCNLKCGMCGVWKNIWDIPDNVVDSIKKDLMPYLEYVTWHGGEVFLYKRFEELFDYAAKCRIKQEIITNGLLIDEAITQKIVDYNTQLTLSIDGVNKNTYEKIRNGGHFNDLKKVLDNLKSCRNDNKNSKMNIRMNTIISELNYIDLFNFLDFAHEYNMQEIYFFPLIFDLKNDKSVNDFISVYKVVAEYMSKNKSKFLQRAAEYGINVISTIPDLSVFNEQLKFNGAAFNNRDNEVCPGKEQTEKMIEYDREIYKICGRKIQCAVPWQRLRIDKAVRPHCFCRGDANVATLSDNFILDGIWNGRHMQSYRKMIINEDFKCSCNPSCYLGMVPNSQYNGVV